MIRIVVFVALSLTAAAAWADHDAGCVPGGADPATYNAFDFSAANEPLLGYGGPWYVEERDVPPPANVEPPIPGAGTLTGGGTWVYQEGNGVAGLQRGGCGGLRLVPAAGHSAAGASCIPICRDVGSEYVCLGGVDPINDEHCGHGPDILRG